MSRYRVVKEEILAEGRQGPLKTVLVAQENGLAAFSSRERRAILIACAQRMGDMWLAVYLPKRFDMAYATSDLGYSVTSKYEQKKRGMYATPRPLVWRGDLLEKANEASAVGKTGPAGPSVTIRIPMPDHRLASEVKRELMTVPSSEVKAMAHAFNQRLKSLFKNSDTPAPNRSRLTNPQRLTVGLKERSRRGRPPGKRKS